MKTFAKKVEHEVSELLPPLIFFFVAFHLLAFSRALILRQYGISMSAVAGATIGALLVSKAILLTDLLPFMNRYPDKPLIYNIVWKSTIYIAAAMIIHYLEELIPAWWRMHNFTATNHTLFEDIIWPHFWVIQLWLSFLLFVYCSARELVRAIGPREVRKMVFGNPGKGAS